MRKGFPYAILVRLPTQPPSRVFEQRDDTCGLPDGLSAGSNVFDLAPDAGTACSLTATPSELCIGEMFEIR